MRTVAVGAAALLLTAIAACGDREPGTRDDAPEAVTIPAGETVQETGATPEAPRTYAFEDRQDFSQSVRDRLADLDRQTEELASQSKSTGGSVSDRALAGIRTARRAVDRGLARVDNATAENWEEVRRGVDQSVESLAEAVERAYPK
jgi:hypothetical protein